MMLKSDGVYSIDVIGEDTEAPYTPTTDTYLNLIRETVSGRLRRILEETDLTQYVESTEDIYQDHDVEVNVLDGYIGGSNCCATYEITATIWLRNKQLDVVKEYRSIIGRVLFYDLEVSIDSTITLKHRVERFVNEVVKHLSQ